MRLLDSIVRGTSAWRVAGALVAISALGAGAWFGYQKWGPGSGRGTAATDQIVPVQRGDLVSSVAVNGALSFPTRETLTFGTAGTVDTVSVSAGQTVEAGQEIARLDRATLANLQAAVAQARVNARNAQDALNVANTPDPAKLAQAQLDVQTAQSALDALANPTGTALAQARLDMQSAETALDALMNPTALARAQAESAVATARLTLQNAEQDRQSFIDANTGTQLAASAQVAETALKNALDALAVTRATWDAKLPPYGVTETDTLATYRRAFKSYVGIDLSKDSVPSDPDSVLAASGVDLSAAYASGYGGTLASGTIPADDPATPWDETTVSLWKSFFPGTLTATCASAPTVSGALCISNELQVAWTAYRNARDNRASQENQASIAIAAAQASVDKATLALDALKVTAGPAGVVALTRSVNDQAVALARARLDDAHTALRILLAPDSAQIALKQAALDTARRNVQYLEQGLPVQVALKKAQLDTAKKNLSTLENGDPVVIDLLESNLDSANAALVTAQSRLAGAVLVAPWAGQIGALNVIAGQTVSGSLAVAEIVDPTRVQLIGTIDEIDVLYVQPGTAARVTLDALGGQAVQGTVSTIATQGNSQQGVVTFPVAIDVTAPRGVQLREGLSATATIVLNQESNVLLIPSQAITGTFAQPVVRVLKGKAVEQQPVTLGNSDGFWVAVTGGLAEGDRVVVSGVQTTTGQLNQVALRGIGAVGSFQIAIPGDRPFQGGGAPTGAPRGGATGGPRGGQ